MAVGTTPPRHNLQALSQLQAGACAQVALLAGPLAVFFLVSRNSMITSNLFSTGIVDPCVICPLASLAISRRAKNSNSVS